MKTPDHCRVCGAKVLEGVFTEVAGEPLATAFVFPNASSGSFGFCNLCLEANRFTGLSAEDIAAVRALFAEIQERDRGAG